MKSIKILGTGCAKCKQTEQVVRDVIAKNGIDATVEKIEDLQQIMEYDVLYTPAVVIDEVVRLKGKVPTAQEVLTVLQ